MTLHYLNALEHITHPCKLQHKSFPWAEEITLYCTLCDKELLTVYEDDIVVSELIVTQNRFEQLAEETPKTVHDGPGLPAYLHEVEGRLFRDEPDEVAYGFLAASQYYDLGGGNE